MTERDTNAENPLSLSQAKQWVRERYLGKFGIHGVGTKESQRAIRVYVHQDSPELKQELKQIQNHCAPYRVEVVLEESPTVQPPPRPSDE